MYAVINSGGKQYKVEKDEILRLERLDGEKGAKVDFDVSMVANGKATTLGSPLVKGATVTGEILDQIRDDKIIVFKKKRRQNYRRKQGHRQDLTIVKIKDIKEGK